MVGVILLWGRVGLVGDGEMDGWMDGGGRWWSGGRDDGIDEFGGMEDFPSLAGDSKCGGKQKYGGMVVAKMAGSEYLGSSSFTLAPRHHYHTLVPKLDEIMMDAPAQ